MLVPLSWLREYVPLPASVAELVERLTLAGLESSSIRAIAELRQSGYSDDHIGLVAKDSKSGKTVRTDGSGDVESNVAEGAAIGAVAGAATGAAVGAGILMGIIPVIGPVLAIGTLGTILINAAGGAAIATVAGALVGWGVSEEDAKYYEGEVKAGRYLVTVDRGTRSEDAPARS